MGAGKPEWPELKMEVNNMMMVVMVVITLAVIPLVVVVVDNMMTDMKFVQNFTPPDFQVKNFTPSISPNFNSFSKKKHKK